MSLRADCVECGTAFVIKNPKLKGKTLKCKRCGVPVKVKLVKDDVEEDDEWDMPGSQVRMPSALPPRVKGVKNKPKKTAEESQSNLRKQ